MFYQDQKMPILKTAILCFILNVLGWNVFIIKSIIIIFNIVTIGRDVMESLCWLL